MADASSNASPAATGRRAEQVALLKEIVAQIFDGDTQFEVTLRIATLAREVLKELPLAREYFEKAPELRPDDRATLVALESLYEELGDSPALLEILERRVEVAENPSRRRRSCSSGGRGFSPTSSRIAPGPSRSTRPSSTSTWIASAVDALESLYGAEERWDDLVEPLRASARRARGAPSADLHVKIARVAARHLKDSARAFDELEAALEIERQHEGAIAELERVLDDRTKTRSSARAPRRLLEPLYLVRADYDRVMRTIAARLDASDEPAVRRELLTRLAQLHEEQKEDYVAALDTIAELFHDDLSDEATSAELERLAKVAGAEKRLAEIYATELESVNGDDPTTAKLAARTGEIFASLGEIDRALAFYRRALAFEPESDELFAAIDALLSRTERHEERVSLYKSGLDHNFEPADRLRYLHTIASSSDESSVVPTTRSRPTVRCRRRRERRARARRADGALSRA